MNKTLKITSATTAAVAAAVIVAALPSQPKVQVKAKWFQRGKPAGWVVEESTDLIAWRNVLRVTNTIGASNTWVTNTWTTTNINAAFFRMGAF